MNLSEQHHRTATTAIKTAIKTINIFGGSLFFLLCLSFFKFFTTFPNAI